jgi:beta-1,4-mannosyltransferase
MTRPSIRVAVVVLGDLGRSPRMQYHALALADAGARVALIGLAGSEPFAAVRAQPAIQIRQLAEPPPPRAASGAAYLAGAARRAAAQGRALHAALEEAAAAVVLVQTPPALPTLPLALYAARRRGTRLVVDWHNLGHALLALRLGAGHPAVRLTAVAERRFGRRADAHLCVSAAMRDALAQRWGIDAVVLPDRPARPFAPLPPAAREAAARALAAQHGWRGDGERPAVVVAPSGWSADDDFDLLLAALPHCDAQLAQRAGFPGLLLLLTGRGPRRDAVAARLAALRLAHVTAVPTWLAADAYPAALAAADLGLCLHRSASRLDLPMKIADMFGAGLPVGALDDGGCLAEMVRPGVDAQLFADAEQLSAGLVALLGGRPGATPALDRLRAGALAAAAGPRWDEAWATHAAPLLLAGAR